MRFQEVFDYIETTPWADGTSDEVVFEAAGRAFESIKCEGSFTKSKTFYRLAGQSGTGKTTQLLPVVLEAEKRNGNAPVVIAMRKFVEFHPHFEALFKEYGKNSIRTKIDGFVHKCLCVVLKMFIEEGYLIVLDLTILHPTFEGFVLGLLKENNYSVQYHVMAVNGEISNYLINKRSGNRVGDEGGRQVKAASANYFNKAMPLGLGFLANENHDNVCFVWSVFDRDPLYYGKISGALESIKKGQQLIQDFLVPESELREAKLNCLLARR